MNSALTDRGLLRAVLLAFALFLAYRFLAGLVTILLVLAAALLLAVILSAPVEALHKRTRLSRPISTVFIVLGVVAVLAVGGLLLFPVLAQQASEVVPQLPSAVSQLVERARSLAQSYGLSSGSSSLSSYASQLLGGALGLFSGLVSVLSGLVIALLVAVYLAAQPGAAIGWAVRFFPPEKRDGSVACSRTYVRAFSVGSRAGSSRWL